MNDAAKNILAHAVALAQSGRLKNEIHLGGRTVYVSNFDNTVLLKFDELVGVNFEEVGFEANDYEGDKFKVVDGKVIFEQISNGIIREKICSVSERTFSEIEDLYNKYYLPDKAIVELDLYQTILSLLEEGLSHIEISAEKGRAQIIQRDIYSGKIIRLKMDRKGFFSADKVTGDFGPMGMRTSDFQAVFSFCNRVKFSFHSDMNYCLIRGDKFKMTGVIAGCLYDEMGQIETVEPRKQKGKDDGGQIKKDRGSEQGIASKVDKGKREKGVKTDNAEKPRRSRNRKAGFGIG